MEKFFFKNKEVEYYSLLPHTQKSFTIVFKNELTNKSFFFNQLQNCCKNRKIKKNYYLLTIPLEFSNEKEILVLEFINAIISTRKLIDQKMSIIADDNYFQLYKKQDLPT